MTIKNDFRYLNCKDWLTCKLNPYKTNTDLIINVYSHIVDMNIIISDKIFCSRIIGITEIIPIKTGIWINESKFMCFLNVSMSMLSGLLPSLFFNPALIGVANNVIPKKYNPEIINKFWLKRPVNLIINSDNKKFKFESNCKNG